MIAPTRKTRIESTILAKEDNPKGLVVPSTRTARCYSSLAASITRWTSNLLASAVVIVIALTFGSQLVALWVSKDAQSGPGEFVISQSWPTLQSCSLEFGDLPFQLTRETFSGAESDVVLLLQARCRKALENGARPVGKMGERESDMISRSASRTPVEHLDGKWRILLVPKLEGSSPVPIAVGIRDDCPSTLIAPTNSNRIESRLVVWGLAIEAEPDRWTTYVATAASLDSSLGLDSLLPGTAKRTLAMTQRSGGSLIGFSGGDLDSAITYYKEMARNLDWKLKVDTARPNQMWSAGFLPPEDSTITGLQVHLTLDHNRKLSGILMLHPDHRRTSESKGKTQSP